MEIDKVLEVLRDDDDITLKCFYNIEESIIQLMNGHFNHRTFLQFISEHLHSTLSG